MSPPIDRTGIRQSEDKINALDFATSSSALRFSRLPASKTARSMEQNSNSVVAATRRINQALHIWSMKLRNVNILLLPNTLYHMDELSFFWLMERVIFCLTTIASSAVLGTPFIKIMMRLTFVSGTIVAALLDIKSRFRIFC